MQERRTCSKVKPWLYFLIKLVIYLSIATMIIFYFERVLKRTDSVRKVKVKERYKDEI